MAAAALSWFARGLTKCVLHIANSTVRISSSATMAAQSGSQAGTLRRRLLGGSHRPSMVTASASPAPPLPVAERLTAADPERWRHTVASATLTVLAIAGPLVAGLGALVRSSHRAWHDLLPLASIALLLPGLRLGKSFCVRVRAMAGILVLFAGAFVLISRFGCAGGLSVLVVVACVLGIVVGGRIAGLLMIGAAALAYVVIGLLVSKGILSLAAPDMNPHTLQDWLRLAASTTLQSTVLAVVIDFVIRHVEANGRATTTALEELRVAYASLRENEERYRSVVDHCLDGVLLTSPSGEIFDANPAICRMVGRTAEEICAMGRDGVVDSQDSRVAALIEERRRTRKARGEMTMLHKDGTRVPVEMASAVFTDRHGQLRTSMSVRDLRDQKRAERDHRVLAELGAVLGPAHRESSLADVAPLLVRNLADLGVFFLIDSDGEMRRAAVATRDPANKWIAEVIMQLPATAPADHFMWQIFRDRKPLIRTLTPEKLEQKAQSPEHLRALRAAQLKSTLVVPLLVGNSCVGVMGLSSASEIFDERDLPVAMEIGRRCALFVESARLRQSEKRATQARDEVLSIVAQDLRNPLGSFMMQLSLLQRPHGRPERRSMKAVNALERAVMRMSRILNDLVELAKVESGRLELSRTQVPAGDFIVEVVEALRQEAASLSLNLVGDVPRNVPDVWVDKCRMLHVFENLVDNAMKFTQEGGISLGARAAGSEVVFWVADTGTGIPPEDLPHLFDRDWHAKKSERTGSGIGLAIVNGTVQAHGGRVWVESTVGVGST
ncbi:MAG: ATP-binding protein, partial [Pseudomonadota bacterium]